MEARPAVRQPDHGGWVRQLTASRREVMAAAGVFGVVAALVWYLDVRAGLLRSLYAGHAEVVDRLLTLSALAWGPAVVIVWRALSTLTQHAEEAWRLEAEVTRQRQATIESAATRRGTVATVRAVLDAGEHMVMYRQPIVDLHTGTTAGYEALARFVVEPRRSPDQWLADAESLGMSVELEYLSCRRSLDQLSTLPADEYLSINLSPDALRDERVLTALESGAGDQVVVEVSEHKLVADHATVAQALARLRPHGVRLAIDSAGTGLMSFSPVSSVAPDIVKVDRDLTSSLQIDRVRRALGRLAAVITEELGADIVVEGVEDLAELYELQSLGVRFAQGYLLGRPAPFGSAVVDGPAQPVGLTLPRRLSSRSR